VGDSVGPVPDELRAAEGLDEFYAKYIAVAGFPILGSSRVSDAALREAAWIVRHMLQGRNDVLAELTGNGVHLVVMAYDEYTTDVPEHAHLKFADEGPAFWDRRARGLGGNPVSCAEENLLCHPGDPYSTENILIHEFAHIIHGQGVGSLDPTFDERLATTFEQARERGLWQGTYAATNRSEYWAEAVQSWFDNNRQDDSLHNHVDTRIELLEYDPQLAALCKEVFGDGDWRYLKPAQRAAADRAHLSVEDLSNLPPFEWREEALPELARVLIQTELGEIELELDGVHAPQTTANFLHYVHQGLYNDGEFFRAVTPKTQVGRDYPIEVVQARADESRSTEFPRAIPLERTRDTGLAHLDGTISMARGNPDTGRHHFFICIGDQPELNFNGRRNPDGQGFAAFGQVVEGMDVVRRIQELAADGEQILAPVRIQRAIRRN